MRYIWDQAEQYFGKLTFVLFPILLLLRVWDRLCSQGVTQFVAISRFVSARIRCFYGRSAAVIFPPVDTSWIKPTQSGVKGVAFLYAGALVPYKRPDLVVKAFNRLKEELWIVGSGPEEERLRAIAGPNVHFFGRVSDEELADFYGRCRALIFPGKEDFGMIPIECLAAGRPVIALYEGALKETLNGMKPWIPQKRLEEHGESEVESNFVGVFVRNRASDEVRALIDAVSYFVERETQFKVKSCVEAARQFSPERFRESWERLLCRLVPAYQRALFAGREQIGNDVKAETTAV
jgi:glycosyltransferase involved in cell wall biosynthesis